MHFQLLEVSSDTQFNKMIPSLWHSMNNPRNVLLNLLFPIHGKGPSAETSAITSLKTKFLNSWHSNPCGHYIQILDKNENNSIIAAAYWNFYDQENNPFLKNTENNPTWWPEGSEIWKYTKMAMDRGGITKIERQGKPHAYLGMLYTSPSYRRHGAATMLLNWGLQKADEMGLECFLDSTEMAVPFYENAGFVLVDETRRDVEEDPSEEWMELRRLYPLELQFNMWRPVRGIRGEGEKYPWEV